MSDDSSVVNFCWPHHSSPNLRGSLLRDLIVFRSSVSVRSNSNTAVSRCCIWTLSWASMIYVMSCFACAPLEGKPSIQCCFSQGSPVLLPWCYSILQITLKSESNEDIMRPSLNMHGHIKHEIKPESPSPTGIFLEWSYKGALPPNPQTPYLTTTLQEL